MEQRNPPIVFAHRGYSSAAPENTLSAFALASTLGVKAVELDVQLSADGELVVIHDYDLRRLAGRDQLVCRTAAAELTRIEVTANFSPRSQSSQAVAAAQALAPRNTIPTLDAVLSEFGADLFFDIEMKQQQVGRTPLASALVALIDAHALHHRCFVSSFNPYAVKAINRINRSRPPERRIKTAAIYSRDADVPWILRQGFGAVIGGATILKPNYSQVTSNSCRRTAPVLTWTVNDAATAHLMWSYGVAGVITDDALALNLPLTADPVISLFPDRYPNR